MIYLDNAATTKMSEIAMNKIKEYSCEKYFNASASYKLAINNHNDLLEAKKTIIELINAEDDDNIIFCSCATEGNNTVIKTFANKQSKQMLFSMGEHPSVFQVAKNLQEQGYNVKFINLQKNGEIDYKHLELLLKEPTTFISTMLVSNETGAINDLKKIYELKQKFQPDAIIHCDMVQGFGKIDIDVCDMGIDLATMSSHKLHGPKGLGAIYVKNGVKIKPLLLGGGQENGLRSGTENLPSIMALKSICEELKIQENYDYVSNLKHKFLEQIKDISFEINGNGSPYILSISFDGIRGETLMNMCQEKGVIFGLGSACSSKKVGNRVLEEMKQKNIIGSIRISFSTYNTESEVIEAGKIINQQAKLLYDTLR